jgi:hypothetical protein
MKSPISSTVRASQVSRICRNWEPVDLLGLVRFALNGGLLVRDAAMRLR